MSGFLLSVGLFIFAFVIHIVIWRIEPPRATGQSLILLLVTCVVGGAVLLAAGAYVLPGLQPFLPAPLGEWIQAIVTALAVACVYVMNYPAVEVESPTLVMIDIFARAEPDGLTRDDLYQRLSNDFLVVPRIEDLLREDLATESDGKCRLTVKGMKLEQIFNAWRRLLRAGIGG
jgi:hypothetical protein